MRTHSSGMTDLHISNEEFRYFRRLRSLSKAPLEVFISSLIDRVFRMLHAGGFGDEQQKFLEFCRGLSQKGDSFRTGILYAHGNDFFRRWCYYDGLFPKSVQRWIDKYDGSYDLLVVGVCNPGKRKPYVRESLAVIPTDIVHHLLDHYLGVEHLLVIPEKGAVPFNVEKIRGLPYYDLLGDIQSYNPDID